MTNFVTIVMTTAKDPLVAAFAVIATGVLVSRLLFRQKPIWRAIARIVFLALLTLVLLSNGIVPYESPRSTGAPADDAIVAILKIVWWLWAAWFLVALIHSVVVIERRPREEKLVQDLVSALIYLAAAFAIVAYVLDFPIQGLLATSGVIAIVLGLALQSTLNDVFSGLVLSLSRPYRQGDWINIEGGTEGHVVEMNWRATHILTSRHDLAIVPNSGIVKSKIVNASSPSDLHGVTVTVQLDSGTPPATGVRILELAMLNCKTILAAPSPSVRVVSIDAVQTGYELIFFIEKRSFETKTQNELFDRIFRHVSALGAQLAPSGDGPTRALSEQASNTEKTGRDNILELVELFTTLTPQERAEIATRVKRKSYETGETLVEPGTVLYSLFIVGEGVLSVTQRDDRGATEVLRFGPGDYFGEIGLLTGASSDASVTALAPSAVLELSKEDLTPILEARPEIAHELCHALARQQAAGRTLSSPDLDKSEPVGKPSAWFLERIHDIFQLRRAS